MEVSGQFQAPGPLLQGKQCPPAPFGNDTLWFQSYFDTLEKRKPLVPTPDSLVLQCLTYLLFRLGCCASTIL